jgi:hypothetical protein
MAEVNFVPMSGSSHRTASDQRVLRVAAAPTTSYVATTNVVNVHGWEYVIVGVDYTNGDETTIQLVPQGYDGTTWRDFAFKATQGSAVSEVTSDVIQLTKATFSTRYGAGTVGNVALPPICVIGFQQFRVQVKSVGGTPTGLVGITASAGVGIKTGA